MRMAAAGTMPPFFASNTRVRPLHSSATRFLVTASTNWPLTPTSTCRRSSAQTELSMRLAHGQFERRSEHE